MHRRIVPCPECSVPLIWQKHWWRALVTGIVLSLGVFPAAFVVSLFAVQGWTPIEIVMRSSIAMGLVLFLTGGLFVRPVRVRE